MTENEAVVFIKNANELSKKAIHDLEQIKDKAERIGKIGEYYANLENCYKEIKSCEIAVNALEEIQQYRAIGTVEECREARERQRAKKPILCMNEKIGMFVDYADGHGEYKTQMNNWWRCPCCNEVVGQRVIVHKHIHDQRKKNFCEKCGQAIDWSDTD